MSPFTRYISPAILWAAIIFFVSSLPQAALPVVAFQVSDKLIHFVVYLLLGFLLARAFMYRSQRRTKPYSFIALVVGILYGASDEFHQMFVTGRYAEWTDFLADVAGVIVGVAAYFLFVSILKK